MSLAKSFLNPSDPGAASRLNLPTMYDLPSEDPEELGLPDEFHDLQPQLLSATLRLSDGDASDMFTGTDLNLYYDPNHPLWHKRPDWFLVIGVPRLYDQRDLRLSYVIWQERVSPLVVVELLSPGTEKEDLGETSREPDEPPTKWDVYEQILKIPYYLVFDRYTDTLRAFQLTNDRYQELDLSDRRLWVPALNLGLGLWQGSYQGITRLWLRWYDQQGEWIPTDAEANQRLQQEAERDRQRAEIAEARAQDAEARANALAQRLRELGIDPNQSP